MNARKTYTWGVLFCYFFVPGKYTSVSIIVGNVLFIFAVQLPYTFATIQIHTLEIFSKEERTKDWKKKIRTLGMHFK